MTLVLPIQFIILLKYVNLVLINVRHAQFLKSINKELTVLHVHQEEFFHLDLVFAPTTQISMMVIQAYVVLAIQLFLVL